MIDKQCPVCKQRKALSEFFSSPFDGRASDIGTSTYCRSCHSAGKIAYGYGWYAGGYETPNDRETGNIKVSWLAKK